MKEKLHIAVLSLGICTLIGMTFAVSVRDYKEKEPKLNSTSASNENSKKFVCTKESVSDSSPATKEYNKNIEKLEEFLDKVDSIGGDATTLEDPCAGLKGKERTECNINNIEFNGLLRQVKKLEEKMIPYEECMEKLGLLDESDENKKTSVKTNKDNNIKSTDKKIKDCGTMTLDFGEEVTTKERKVLSCISDAILKCSPAKIGFLDNETKELITYTVHNKESRECNIGVTSTETNKRCDIPLKTIKDLENAAQEEDYDIDFLISPIAMMMTFEGPWTDESGGEEIKISCKDDIQKTAKSEWSEGKWSICTNGKQSRTIECQSGGKKVDDKKCEGKKPASTKVCEKSDSSTKDNQCTNTKIKYVSQFGTKGTDNGQFYAPTSMITDSQDNLYVFDSLNNRIQIFNPEGKYLKKIDNFKLENASLLEFLDLEIDHSGNIYAVEPYKVQKFDSSGKILLKFGTNGTKDGQFNIAQGIAVAKNGDIYVVDTGNNRVQKFDSSGKYVSQFGTKGTGKGQFNLPRHIAIDSIGNIYVVDNRIQKFASSGKYISEFALNTAGKIAVDTSDNIYIGSSNGVDKYTNSGILLNKFDTKGAGNNSQSYGVWGLTIDSLNNIYISSGLEDRVQKFKQTCQS